MALDIVLFPHCDIHVAMTGTPSLEITVMERDYRKDSSFPDGEDESKFELNDITSSCSFFYFSPFENVGNRMRSHVDIDSDTGLVTPTSLGTTLVFIIYRDDDGDAHTIVARIQVHQEIKGWWFGNSSITSAKDTFCAHSQPSIYALFSDDTTGTDLVGDITGHGYVDLTSLDPVVFTMDDDGRGRIWGHNGGSGTLRGSFLGTTHNLPVTIVDYTLRRDILEPIQFTRPIDEAHNILFIPEGFRDTSEDREKFDHIVTKVTEELFHKPRHQPYGLLQGSFNVFKAFIPSDQYTLTCGFKINDESSPGNFEKTGYPIPYTYTLSSNLSNPYTEEELINIVGLPKRNESRTPAQLRALWQSQSLSNFNNARLDDKIIQFYKKQQSLGILEARDTFFGLILGQRFADRYSGDVVIVPANDTPGDTNLPNYINRMYSWYKKYPTRHVSMDTRRHPPELYKEGKACPGSSLMQFIKNLHYKYEPHDQLGLQWYPDVTATNLQNSRGLIAVLSHDGVIGGTSFNDQTLTALTLNNFSSLGFKYSNTATEKILRRDPASDIKVDMDDIVGTIAHEFGHTFNLGDEYEDFIKDVSESISSQDNITSLSEIHLDAQYQTDRLIDMDKVKWFDLLRIKLSAATLEDSQEDAGKLKVKIDPKYVTKWKEAKIQNEQAYIRNRTITTDGVQLPLSFDFQNYIPRLDIMEVDEVNGYIFLGGLELPPHPLPTFAIGSQLFIPQRDSSGDLIYVVEKKVLDFLKNDPTNKNLPLNKDSDTTKINDKVDNPKNIPHFKPPCRSYKLVGIYEGAKTYTGMQYRPAGSCKMRHNLDKGEEGEFCFVCKYLIVNRVDPGLHDVLDHRFYPKAKKN
jgi:hypothetical protein